MVVLGTDRTAAERIVEAIQAMLSAIGQAEEWANPDAEAQVISLRQISDGYCLGVDAAGLTRGRGPSWVLERLDDLEDSPARVAVELPTESSTYIRSFGSTRPDAQGYTIPSRGHFRLPGPFNLVTVAAATIHPRTHVPRRVLDIGRTLVHELVIHAWRDVSYYQLSPGGRGPTNDDPMSQSIHADRPHAVTGGRHNLADYEADLIDYYYDIAQGAARSDEHSEYHRAARDGGRTMVDWQDRTAHQREANQEWLRERQRFIQEAESYVRLRAHAEARSRQ